MQFAEKKDGKLYTNSISALENAFDDVLISPGVSEEIVWDKIIELEKQMN